MHVRLAMRRGDPARPLAYAEFELRRQQQLRVDEDVALLQLVVGVAQKLDVPVHSRVLHVGIRPEQPIDSAFRSLAHALSLKRRSAWSDVHHSGPQAASATPSTVPPT